MTQSYAIKAPTTPALGLIVLRVDETIEADFRDLIPPEHARLHISRVHAGDDLTPETIQDMSAKLSEAASLLPRAADFDVVGYACTSATAQLGAEACLLYTSPSPRDLSTSRMPSSA